MDILKVFDTWNRNLVIAKLGAYGFPYMKNYLSNRLQRVRVNSSFSNWDEILRYMAQVKNWKK